MRNIREALTFDDVLLEPGYSTILPHEVETTTALTRAITLNIPLMSAAMDTVTESPLAITVAQLGGIGVLHKNMSIADQANHVRRVKRFESGMVVDPITITPDKTLADALELMRHHKISGIPVVSRRKKHLVGILTNRDVRFATDQNRLVRDMMTRRGLVTVEEGVSPEVAKKLLHEYRIEKLLVIDKDRHCVGLITVKDIEKSKAHPYACKDHLGRLRVAAAIGTGESDLDRASALMEAGVDVLVVDTAHGHSAGVISQLRKLKAMPNCVDVIAGNVATAEGAKALINAGVDAVKVGIGPGSICTTRIVAGVGVPQLSAVMETVAECRKQDIPVIADGGIKFSGDMAKAIAGGASVAMIGSLLAGTDESPGEVFLFQGRSYKAYRGMGSAGAMARGSADRYFQEQIDENNKYVPEGVEGRVPYKGPASAVIYQLIGGLKASMGYTGNADIEAMQKNCVFRRITGAGFRESHVHDIAVTKEAPNYRPDRRG